MKKCKVGIIGGAGYVGGEMIRLILNHDHCDLQFVSSRSQSGNYLHSTHPDLKGWTDQKFSDASIQRADALFLCMGHGNSKRFIEENEPGKECLVIDLSRDYRLKNDAEDFVYGLCELNREIIQSSNQIANPGCFATAIQLGILPLAAGHHLKSDVHVTAITGSTGAGQNPLPTTHNSWRNNNISIYKAFNHQHLGEIHQSIRQLQDGKEATIHFIPMRGSFTRGIFASIYLESDLSEHEAIELYNDYYHPSPFVHLSESSISVKEVVNTNNALIHISKHDHLLRIECAIDNLLKGAAGQAVQNLNIRNGWEEASGLMLKASVY